MTNLSQSGTLDYKTVFFKLYTILSLEKNITVTIITVQILDTKLIQKIYKILVKFSVFI